MALDAVLTTQIEAEFPGEPIPHFDVLPEKPFGYAEFSHEKSDEQSDHIRNETGILHEHIQHSTTATKNMLIGTMGSGKSEVGELLINRFIKGVERSTYLPFLQVEVTKSYLEVHTLNFILMLLYTV